MNFQPKRFNNPRDQNGKISKVTPWKRTKFGHITSPINNDFEPILVIFNQHDPLKWPRNLSHRPGWQMKTLNKQLTTYITLLGRKMQEMLILSYFGPVWHNKFLNKQLNIHIVLLLVLTQRFLQIQFFLLQLKLFAFPWSSVRWKLYFPYINYMEKSEKIWWPPLWIKNGRHYGKNYILKGNPLKNPRYS